MLPSTTFCNKNSLSSQKKYDGEIVENRKVGGPVVSLWEAIWPKLNNDVCFLLKTLIMPIFKEIEEGRLGKGLFCNVSSEMSDMEKAFRRWSSPEIKQGE
jgi:hypothetical protein